MVGGKKPLHKVKMYLFILILASTGCRYPIPRNLIPAAAFIHPERLYTLTLCATTRMGLRSALRGLNSSPQIDGTKVLPYNVIPLNL